MTGSVALWGGLGIVVGLALLLLALWLVLQWHRFRGELLQTFRQLQESLSHQQQETRRDLDDRLRQTQETVVQVSRSLGRLEEATRQMQRLGQEIQSLQDLLRPPKVRGQFGEYLLEHLLSTVLPRHRFQMQYRFAGGEVADAVIFLEGDRLLVVDAKFPLESFQRLKSADEATADRLRREFVRTVQRHIDAIAQKYLQPLANTLDFAFMYIPAEGVYYEALVQTPEVFDYALEKRVIPVSPGTFYPYLLTLRLAFREADLHRRSLQVIRLLREIQQQMRSLLEQYQVLGRHLGNAQARYQEVQAALQAMLQRLEPVQEDETHAP